MNKLEFSFENMVRISAATVFFRNLNGLSRRLPVSRMELNKQQYRVGKLVNRLCKQLLFEDVGWKRITPVPKLFEIFGVNPENLCLKREQISWENLGEKGFKEKLKQICRKGRGWQAKLYQEYQHYYNEDPKCYSLPTLKRFYVFGPNSFWI